LGVEIDRLTEAEAIASIVRALDFGRGGWIVTAHLEQMRLLDCDPALREQLRDATLVVPDGMPLVWASRLKGTPLPERVAGSDLVWSLTAEAALNGRSVYLLGGAPGACEGAMRALREHYPGLAVAGCHSPPFGFEDDPAEMRRIHRELEDADPDIVYVALGFPKQERLIAQLRAAFPRAWFIGVGVSFSFLCGEISRAPEWMSRAGLEWLHRLVQEPRRLFKRYLLHGVPFAARLLGYAAACRLLERELVPVRSRRDQRLELVTGGRVVFTHGALERRRVQEVAALAEPDPVARQSA
jgi:N-acetylglucosaminyldiphosphoundecaprenol N-acetyl-beta-D-mannosaminyltransferase